MARQEIKFNEASASKKYKGVMELKAPAPVKILEICELYSPGADHNGQFKKFDLKYKLTNPQNRLSAKIRVFQEPADVDKNSNPIHDEPLGFEQASNGEHINWEWFGHLSHGTQRGQLIPHRPEKPYWLKVSLHQGDREVASDKKEFKVEGPKLVTTGVRGQPPSEGKLDAKGKALKAADGDPKLVVLTPRGLPPSEDKLDPKGKALKLDQKPAELVALAPRGMPPSEDKLEVKGKALKIDEKPPTLVALTPRGLPPDVKDVEVKGRKVPVPGALVTAAWSKPKAETEEEVTLRALADDKIEDGSEVEFQIFILKPGMETPEKIEHPKITAPLKGRKAEATWKAVYTRVEKSPERPDFRQWDHPDYIFVAKALGHKEATSEKLRVCDTIQGLLEYPDGSGILAHQRFKLVYDSKFEIESKSDGEGRFAFVDIPHGDYQLELIDDPLKSCHWSKTKVRPGEKSKLIVYLSDQVADGESIALKIFERDRGEDDDPVPNGEFTAQVKSGRAESEWDVVYMEDADDTITAKERAWQAKGFAQFTLPEYYFTAEYKGEKIESGLLTIADIIEGVLEYDTGEKLANQPFKLVFKGCEMLARTDARGGYRVEDVPPGEYSIELVEDEPAAAPVQASAASAESKSQAVAEAPKAPPPAEAKPKTKGKFSALAWSAQKLRPGEKVKLTGQADANVPEGCNAKISIWEEDADGQDDPVPTGNLQVQVKSGKFETEWPVVYMEDTDDQLSSQEEAWKAKGFLQFSLPEYYFKVEAENCEEARSGLLKIADIVEGVLNYDDGTPLAKQKIRLVFSGGAMEATTDDKGGYRITDAPPGPYSLELVE